MLALSIVLIPMTAAIVSLVLGKMSSRRVRDYFAVAAALITFAVTLLLIPGVRNGPIHFKLWEMFGISGMAISVNVDGLSLFMSCLISFMGFLAALYSLAYMGKEENLNFYYFLMLVFIGSMNGAVIAGDLASFFLFWEIMTISSFLLVIFNGSLEARKAGIKYFIMTASGSLLMLLSIGALYAATGTMSIPVLISQGIGMNSWLIHLVLLLFLIGLGIKAGIVPLHTWLPDAYPAAPSPISSLMSGVMIKVGIYMILRVLCQIFSVTVSWNLVVCFLGVLTILIGVIFAMVQHDAKRLLAFHSISQIGYIILGIGIGTTLGIGGALFHVINHAFFKGLLFLCIGAVIYRTGERNLDKLGGLAKVMPITFVTCLVASLSISGVPPFNGFASKWIIYQALIEKGGFLHMMFLAAAMFGSALTLASFLKLIHTVFLGGGSGAKVHPRGGEVSWMMSLPMVVLAGLCIVLGVFAFQVPLKCFVSPVLLAMNYQPLSTFAGFFNPMLAAGLLILGLAAGLVIYLLGNLKSARTDMPYVGGEILDDEVMSGITAEHFYDTIKEVEPFAYLYEREEAGRLDLYQTTMGGVRNTSRFVFERIEQSVDKLYAGLIRAGEYLVRELRKIHSGILPSYIYWVLVGLVILVFLLMR